MSKPLQILVDMDSLLYAAAAAAERSEFVVQFPDSHPHNNEAGLEHFTTRADMLIAIKDVPGTEIYERKQVGPFETAVDALHDSLTDIHEQLRSYYGKTRTMDTIKFVGGSANFRTRLDTHVPYKHNRSNRAPPAHLERLKEYCRKNLKAHRVDFWEADDEVSIRAHAMRSKGIEYVVVSVDKDLLQIPGMHLIPKNGFLDQSELSAAMMLYTQALSGDPTDGVPGCPRIADATATKLLAPLREKYTEPTEDFHREAWAMVCANYKKAQGKKPDAFPWKSGVDGALETIRLVYLLTQYPRDRGNVDLWEPMQ